MINRFLPEKQGLYDPQFEHDACGIGFVANVKGEKSHEIVSKAIRVLINLNHRGASGAETNSGDGAGILTQIPHEYFAKVCKEIDILLPNDGEYGVGMVFLPHDSTQREILIDYFNKTLFEAKLELLGWRDVPIDPTQIGDSAKASMPLIMQVFVKKPQELKSGIDFERKLYLVRKKVENFASREKYYIYLPSFSSRTIVYKGMLMADQVDLFYKDLSSSDYTSALALVHSRYSTNTFPSWERAHPNRYIIHNGEINTIRGNVNWMNAREHLFKTDLFGEDISSIIPIIDSSGSDSSMFDNCFEFLVLSGRSIEDSMMMMIPEPWSKHESMSDEKKALYEFNSCLMEPWDGPAAMAFTDGTKIGAVLDRNGLRPSRYYVTSDNMVVLASEVGVLDIDEKKIVEKSRLKPGRMLLIDTKEGRIISDDELKSTAAARFPYRKWLQENMVDLDRLHELQSISEESGNSDVHVDSLVTRQKVFGYTYEDINTLLIPMIKEGTDPVGAMGNDAPLAVLSDKPQLLYNYFKQLFAQVTNPPIDAIREEIVTSTTTLLGTEGDLINPGPESCRQIKVNYPVIDNEQLAQLKNIKLKGFKSTVLPILFDVEKGPGSLESAMEELFQKADAEIEKGTNILILSDRGISDTKAPIPALLAVSGLHHHLIGKGTRTSVGIVLESGEPREVHHFSLLIGYGVSAVNPYLVFETMEDLINTGHLEGYELEDVVHRYIKIVVKGVIKVLSKMGISTIQSYQGAQIFEAVGLSKKFIDKYFTSTPSRLEGIGIEEVARETLMNHKNAYFSIDNAQVLDTGGNFQWRSNGEVHLYNPLSVHKLQEACRTGDYNLFKEYTEIINNQTQKLCTLRGLMDFKFDQPPVPIEEVESVESICQRFKTGAMSYGSISKEAHETLSIAMNRIKGKSNTGEGGEDPERFKPLPNGDSRRSAIKQVASGRFGVTSNYLVNANEIQIKMAQGAKPGEGGQLPGAKVYPWIAKVRGSTPGVGLISPPPHHDIYSIEDLAQLIYDLKNANKDARISVKLVSEVGVGTVAAGVSKGRADVVVISGYDGGTGAAPRTSIRHAGLPWELGLAETQQTLVLNGLRSRIRVETDGKLMTGKDVAVAALLGAEEFGFATAPLIVLGCVMMRVCNLDTCPVGVATQNPELRKKFKGKADHVVNFMKFIAQDLREIMAQLGFRSIDEMVGRSDKLKMSDSITHWKAKKLDLSSILYRPDEKEYGQRYCEIKQDHCLEETMDMKQLVNICKPALDNGTKVSATLDIKNTDRVVGTILGSDVTRKYGLKGLPEDTINLSFKGSAGQSFGAFVPKGITLQLEGDANDYFGKGLSGGKLIVYPSKEAGYKPEENIIIGNVAFYGATSGEAYIRGISGERFCVRNSGVNAVVEGVGDHGCEYMTGGRVVILGPTGRNFAAGMSGGIAYVLDEKGNFKNRCNMEMISLKELSDEEEINEVKSMIEKHVSYTGSDVGKRVLDNWDCMFARIVKVIPKDYERMLQKIREFESKGYTGDEALMEAFNANNKEVK
jgi:glutamate synthase (NADPH/NADH) large chain